MNALVLLSQELVLLLCMLWLCVIHGMAYGMVWVLDGGEPYVFQNETFDRIQSINLQDKSQWNSAKQNELNKPLNSQRHFVVK